MAHFQGKHTNPKWMSTKVKKKIEKKREGITRLCQWASLIYIRLWHYGSNIPTFSITVLARLLQHFAIRLHNLPIGFFNYHNSHFYNLMKLIHLICLFKGNLNQRGVWSQTRMIFLKPYTYDQLFWKIKKPQDSSIAPSTTHQKKGGVLGSTPYIPKNRPLAKIISLAICWHGQWP